jgi:hypothetical protein
LAATSASLNGSGPCTHPIPAPGHARAGGARSRAISDRIPGTFAAAPQPRPSGTWVELCRAPEAARTAAGYRATPTP